MKKKRAFKRLVELMLQYFGLKEIKETLPVKTEPKILREPYRFWISRASCRMQLLKNQWKFIIQSKERILVESRFCVPKYAAK